MHITYHVLLYNFFILFKTVPVTPPRSLDEGGEPQTAIEDMEVSEYSTEGGPSTMEGKDDKIGG